MTEVFLVTAKMPENDGALNIYDEGLHATAGRVADLLPKLKDGTYKELTISLDER